MTLLERFIREKERTFQEPSRAGVRKGERLGPSVKRASAALYALRDRTQTELAQELATKQPVIARWMSQSGFAKEVKVYAEQFADTVIAFLEEKRATLQTEYGVLQLPDELREKYSAQVRDEIAERILQTYGEDSVIGWQLVMELATDDFKIRMLHNQVGSTEFEAKKLLEKPLLMKEDRQIIEKALTLAVLYIVMLEQRCEVNVWGVPDRPIALPPDTGWTGQI